MKAQTKTVLDNAGAVLKAGGMTFADVVSSRIYVTDATTFQDMNGVYRTYFPTDPPARATVKTALTSNDYVVEITMIAVTRSQDRDHDAERRRQARDEEPEPELGDPRRQSPVRLGHPREHAGEQGRRERRRRRK